MIARHIRLNDFYAYEKIGKCYQQLHVHSAFHKFRDCASKIETSSAIVKMRPHLHANTNEAGRGEAYTNICLDCNTRQNVVIRQASEWFSLKYRLQVDRVCSASDRTEAVFLSLVTRLHCYAHLASVFLMCIFVLMWTRLYKNLESCYLNPSPPTYQVWSQSVYMWQYTSVLQYRMFGTRIINYDGKNFKQRATMKFCCKARFMAATMWEMFVKKFGDSFVSRAMVFWWHSWFAAGGELIEDAERSGMTGTTKKNENIVREAAVLKDNCRASCRMIAKSTGYWKPPFAAFCLMIWKNENCVHDWCRMRRQQNNGNSVLFTRKT